MLNNLNNIDDDILLNSILRKLDEQFLEHLIEGNTIAVKEIFEMRKYYEKIYEEYLKNAV